MAEPTIQGFNFYRVAIIQTASIKQSANILPELGSIPVEGKVFSMALHENMTNVHSNYLSIFRYKTY